VPRRRRRTTRPRRPAPFSRPSSHRTPLTKTKQVFLVFGRTGWIGGLVGDILKQQGARFEYATARLEDRAAVLADIERVKPTHVLNAAGLTGRPNVDWCETHRVETIRANVIGCLTLADVTNSLGIHMTYFVSGSWVAGQVQRRAKRAPPPSLTATLDSAKPTQKNPAKKKPAN
jgi:nucleoside-diphosphate-sugar epimerase